MEFIPKKLTLPLLLGLLGFSNVYSVSYLAEPYVVNPKPNAMTVCWVTQTSSAKPELHYGETEAYGQVAQVDEVDQSDWIRMGYTTVYIQKVHLSGLKPGTKYYYRVIGSDYPDYENHFFTNSNDMSKPVMFIFGGDLEGSWPEDEDVAWVEKRTNMQTAFVLDLGDHAIWKRFRKGWQGRVPVILALGNHDNEPRDGRTKDNLQANHYYDFDNEQFDYSFSYGPVFFIINGTRIYSAVKTETYEWMKSQLAAALQPWKMFACHGIFFSDGTHGDEGPARREQMWPLFQIHNVLLQFNGHQHCYQRTHQVDKNGNKDPDGVYSVTFGGTEIGPIVNPPSPCFAYQYTEKEYNAVGYCLVNGNAAHIELHSRLDAGGFVLRDSFTVVMEGGTPPLPPPPVDPPVFTSANTASAKVGVPFGLRLTYTNPLGGNVTPAYKNKPLWITTSGDSLYGIPATSGVDTVEVVLNVDHKPCDTLVLSIQVAPVPRIVLIDRNDQTSTRAIQIRNGRSGAALNLQLPVPGKFSLEIFDAAGNRVWSYEGNSTNMEVKKLGPIVLSHSTYFAVLKQGSKQYVCNLIAVR